MPGESVEQFVAKARVGYPEMRDVTYENHIQSMSNQMERAIESQLDLNKADILSLFPGPLAFLLKLSWACMKGIATFLAEALVFVVLGYLATKTIEEVAELLVRRKGK